jgi:glycosyltransferase involved in cell wall biosynthesis
MDKSILIVTPFFAPQNHAAVFRVYKLAKYLPQYGWKPIVLTVDTQYLYNEDPGLLAALPKEVEIVQARYIEPTLRGARMALGGQDRTFNALKAEISANGNGAVTGPRSPAKRMYQYLLENWLHNPDAYWTWGKTATAVGRTLIRDRDISVVLTSSSPYSSLNVGVELQKCGAKWVADFRDPLGYSRKLASDVPRVHAEQWMTVRTALHHADAVTVLASSYGSIFRDVFGNGCADPMFIPTGVDHDLAASAEHGASPREPYLIFAGEYLPEYDTEFLEAFRRALTHQDVNRTGITLLVVGTLSLNRSRLMPRLEKLGLLHSVTFLDQMPQSEVYKLIRGARAGVLIPGKNTFWWTNFAKMTDFIGMRKPVLALVPDPSEARTALTRSRLGIFLDGPPEQQAGILTDFVLGRHPMPAPDEDECERYTARRQVQSFVEIFESLTKPKTMSAAAHPRCTTNPSGHICNLRNVKMLALRVAQSAHLMNAWEACRRFVCERTSAERFENITEHNVMHKE